MLFQSRNIGGLQFLSFAAWEKAGLLHGFSMKPQNYADRSTKWRAELQNALPASRLVLPKQVHGTHIARLDAALIATADELVADGLIVPKVQAQSLLIAVRSADCVPLLACSDKHFMVLHAGWRGIAAGIVEKGVEMLREDGGAIELVAGPCAGEEDYQVGAEVLKALGESACYKEAGSGKFLLSLCGTIKQRLASYPSVQFFQSGISSIGDKRFHSHRRESEAAGRSLNFILIS